MLLEKDQEKRLVVEVSNDNLQYNYLLEFRQGAFSSMADKGVSDVEFIRSVVFGSKSLVGNDNKRNFRYIFYRGKESQILHEESDFFQINTQLNSTQLNSDAEVKEAIRIFQNLTSKEIEVFRYLHNIYSKTRLKENLKIERNTYKTHKRHIFEKLEVHSIEAACAWYDKYHVLIKSLE